MNTRLMDRIVTTLMAIALTATLFTHVYGEVAERINGISEAIGAQLDRP